MFVYLFEAKSIQAYLFRSGKLKDVISASERLDRLVDDAPHSTLALVLKAAELESNLLDSELAVKDKVIGFTRAKGGAFYAYCQQQAPLLALRSLWSLSLQQLFPSLEFADALVEGESLAEAMAKGHPALATSRNTPLIKLPISTAPCAHAPRTGLAAVPLSAAAKKEMGNRNTADAIDLDTEHHRQGYRLLQLREKNLISKFTHAPDGVSTLPEGLSFPLDTEDFPGFETADGKKETVRDLALVHLDGNGLGLLLRGLQTALKVCSDEEFSSAFRTFSNALAKATQTAANKATGWLYDQQSAEQKNTQMLPMRPIVLGGDDVTIFCQADLAIGFSEVFCNEFKEASKAELATLHQQYLQKTTIKPYLTASGGILYHKSTHPFTTCHQLVEGLCQEAKQTTKAVDENVGPAALAFYRISTALAEGIASLREQSQHFKLGQQTLISTLGGYLVAAEPKSTEPKKLAPTLEMLAKAICLLRQRNAQGTPLPLSIAKLRQMTTELARGDNQEAERIYQRALALLEQKNKPEWKAWQQILGELSLGATTESWHWSTANNLQSWIADLLIHAHFQPALQPVKGNQGGQS